MEFFTIKYGGKNKIEITTKTCLRLIFFCIFFNLIIFGFLQTLVFSNGVLNYGRRCCKLLRCHKGPHHCVLIHACEGCKGYCTKWSEGANCGDENSSNHEKSNAADEKEPHFRQKSQNGSKWPLEQQLFKELYRTNTLLVSRMTRL